MYAQPGDYILHYSNPNVSYKGVATGTTSFNDVARKLRSTAPTVEAFRAYIPPFSVSISGPANGNNTGLYTWTANPSNGVAPYSYDWSYSTTGSNYIGGFGTTQSITRNLPWDKDLYLKVEVTSSGNHLAYDYHVTRNFTKPPKPLASSTILQSPAIDNRALEITASTLTSTNLKKEKQLPFETQTPISYPNPAANYSTLHYEVKKEGPVKIFLLNFRGERLKTLKNTTQKKGVYSIRHSTSGLNEGIYYYRLLIRGAKETTKLIIAN